ncbi:CD209 antigen-like 8 [Homarus americanus]|uniref:CD209 antigen-like 8 n=1 Tax=Homarus americanus TaxID=6706 RepID=A0A8J5N3S8_HOMAM|nr:CD209 antigen-like 8 [Homarus americanus]
MKTRVIPPPRPQFFVQPSFSQIPFTPSPYSQIPFVQSPFLTEASHLHPTFLDNPLLLPSLLLILGFTGRHLTTNLTTTLADKDSFQRLLFNNRRTVDDIKYNLTNINYHHRHKETPNLCKTQQIRDEPDSLSSGFLSLQESVLDLQKTLTRRLHRKVPQKGGDMNEILDHMLLDLETRSKDLEKRQADGMTRHLRHSQEHLRGCREPFFVLGGECFYLSYKNKLSWHDANSSCTMMGAHLAEPGNLRDLAAILQNLPTKLKRWWVGGSDEAQEGDWRWLSGRPVSSSDWREGQPSNISLTNDVQDCLALAMVKTQSPPLDDYSCWKKRAFICQQDLE